MPARRWPRPPVSPYEAALVTLGQLAGAVPSDGDHGASAAPDASWIFGDVVWVAWEAKSEAGRLRSPGQPERQDEATPAREGARFTRFRLPISTAG